MGITAFIVLAILEIALAVRTCRKKSDRKTWRRDRLVIRISEVGCITLHLLTSAAQKWRFIPVLVFLAVLLLIAALTMLIKRNQEGEAKKPAGIIVSCVLCILLFSLLLIPAFLFTGYSGLKVSGPHKTSETSAILIDSSRTDPFEQDGSFREVPVHFYYPSDGTQKYPLVIFSHGAFGYYQSNTSTYMELASNGYVVAALDHPHHAFFTKDTAGEMVLVDMDFLNTAMTLNNEMDAETQYALYTQWMALRTADMNFVLGAVKAAALAHATDSSWYLPEGADAVRTMLQMIDPSSVGLMGHSMGGATAVELGRERDDVSAVIDIDGTMLSEYTGIENGELTVSNEPYTVPVLEFNNWSEYNDRMEYMAQGGIYPNDVLIRNAAESYSVTIRNTEHMDFTDLPLLSPFLGKLLGSGERDTAEAMTIVNRLVLSFFNRYLKGEGDFTVQEVY